MQWHVLYLKPRTEKKVAGYCDIVGLNHYLPLRRETKIYQRRKVTVDKPVFPGYFFAAFDRAGRLEVLKTNNVVRIIDPPDQAQFLHELEQVRLALDVDPTLGAVEAIKAGKRVMIKGGPFMGIEGMVAVVRGPGRVLLNVDIIGQAVVVEVDRDLLQPVD
jgi:transcription antitermination factor NusG